MKTKGRLNRLPMFGFIANLAAIAAAALASWQLATARVYASFSTESAGPGQGPLSTSSATLVDVNGSDVYVLLAIPIVITIIPLLLRRTSFRARGEIAAVFLMSGFVLLGIASIGMFYIPAALLTFASALLGAFERQRRPAIE